MKNTVNRLYSMCAIFKASPLSCYLKTTPFMYDVSKLAPDMMTPNDPHDPNDPQPA